MNNLLLYGGTFDPPHLGHLQIARNVQAFFQFERFIFLPCKTPILKPAASANAFHRIKMLCLNLENDPFFEIDLREIRRSSPSFMVDTLRSYHDEKGPKTAISILLGMDAFMQLPKWHQWGSLLDNCHLLVVQRPGIDTTNIPQTLRDLLQQREVTTPSQLLNTAAGCIYRFDAGNYPIASSTLRKDPSQKAIDLAEPVHQYIKQQGLYTPRQ